MILKKRIIRIVKGWNGWSEDYFQGQWKTKKDTENGTRFSTLLKQETEIKNLVTGYLSVSKEINGFKQ